MGGAGHGTTWLWYVLKYLAGDCTALTFEKAIIMEVESEEESEVTKMRRRIRLGEHGIIDVSFSRGNW